ncbi:hypothetical protein Amsp01_077960 [Amycolatopsis sp. NBRC 101858]|uniref:hypothetical protein n=1 Tax=Amycolatopsis sp. NBRC 101858 TaxID=3032200 RepID=UPI0024A1324C|nr:hypothetical protein [Amycolatopsis sp. NBRC 101858]GLY41773.1 hypothetical protein Amsp01_077960 [Amycolatopsis sp. NBRC 101858]
MDVVAQRVRTTWTKRSRGGPAAAVRNRVPVAFPLPDGALLHEVNVDESTGFEPRFTVPDALDGVRLREVDGSLAVRLELAPMSRPRRDWRPAPVRLRPGEWLRWQINYRFGSMCSCGAEWRYRLETLNLAYGTVADFAGEPTRTVIERGDLR